MEGTRDRCAGARRCACRAGLPGHRDHPTRHACHPDRRGGGCGVRAAPAAAHPFRGRIYVGARSTIGKPVMTAAETARKPGSTKAPPMRSGAQFLDAIRADGRRVYFDGELVRDVTTHPAFRGAAKSPARLYDIAPAPPQRETMTYPSPATGGPVRPCLHIP